MIWFDTHWAMSFSVWHWVALCVQQCHRLLDAWGEEAGVSRQGGLCGAWSVHQKVCKCTREAPVSGGSTVPDRLSVFVYLTSVGVSQAFFFLFPLIFCSSPFGFPAESLVWHEHLLWRSQKHLCIERISGSASVAYIVAHCIFQLCLEFFSTSFACLTSFIDIIFSAT